jgi:hypothetical protein
MRFSIGCDQNKFFNCSVKIDVGTLEILIVFFNDDNNVYKKLKDGIELTSQVSHNLVSSGFPLLLMILLGVC